MSGFCVTTCLAAAPLAYGADSPALSTAGFASVVARAEQMGTPTGSIEAAQTTLADAQRRLDAKSFLSGPPEDPKVTLVDVAGNFTDTAAHTPHGEAPPTGNVAAFLLDSTGEIVGTYIGVHRPSLLGLGAIEKRAVPGASARITATHSRTTRARNQAVAHAAVWGTKCTFAQHCYATAEWAMTGSEQVKGAIATIDTTSMNVPYSESGAFVDDELWVRFPGYYWMEIGQEGGDYGTCCKLWWFYAYRNNLEYYAFTHNDTTTVWEQNFNTWNNMGIKTIGGGGWCWYIGPSWETQWGCRANFPETSKLLEDGMEVSDEAEPTNRAQLGVSAEWMNGSWYTWNKGNEEASSRLCVSRAAPGAAPGNISVWTC
jgi:hypothetical protein